MKFFIKLNVCLIIAHLFLELGQLSRHALHPHTCLLQLLMSCSNQMAVSICRMTCILQLKGEKFFFKFMASVNLYELYLHLTQLIKNRVNIHR